MIGPDGVIFKNRPLEVRDYYEQFQEYFSGQDEN
jgi:hypothetical protein